MPLLHNAGQPFFKNPNAPNRNDSCFGDYCYPISAGDYIRQQWYQTPCGNNDLTDPEFEDVTLGAELLSDTGFPSPSPSWVSSPGAAWTPSGGVNSIAVYDATYQTNSYTQGPIVITAGNVYQLTITVGGLQSGDYLNVYLGSNTVTFAITTNGTAQIFNLIAGADNTNIVFEAVSANNFHIDNVSLKAYTLNSWDTNGNWQTEEGSACKSTTGTGMLEETIADYIDAGGYYSLTFTISGYQGAGTIVPKVANVANTEGLTISGNGIYTLYFEPTLTGVVSFTPSSDWEGCITGLDLRQLRNDFIFYIVGPDLENGDVYDMSTNAVYWRDKITLTIDPVAESLPYGCYYLETFDSCLVIGNDLVSNGNFAAGDDDWTRNNAASQYSFSGGTASFLFDPTDGSNLVTNGDFAAGATGWTVGAGWGIVTSAVHTPGSTAALSQSITISAAPIIVWVRLTLSGRTAGSFTVTVGDKTSGSYQDNGTFWVKLLPTTGPGAVTFSINPSTAFDGTIDDIEIYQSTLIISDFPLMTNLANVDITAGNYSLSYDITAISATGTVGVAGILLGMTQSAVYNTTVATHTVSITDYVPGAQAVGMTAQFSGTDSAGGKRYYEGSITIDNVRLVRVEPFEATYTSECLNYQLVNENTKLITAYCDQEAFGFEFENTGYRLQQRMECRSLNEFQKKEKRISLTGDGNARVAYASNELWWQFVTGFMDSSAHEALGIQVDCDHFMIGESEETSTEYVAEADDYTPQWRGDGDFMLVASQLNLRLKTGGMKFNRHT